MLHAETLKNWVGPGDEANDEEIQGRYMVKGCMMYVHRESRVEREE